MQVFAYVIASISFTHHSHDPQVSPLCLGAMSVGEAWKEFMGSMDKEQAFKLLDAFVEAGGNFIDTANNYQNDDSEKWLGEWMKERKNRDQIVLASE
jgi:aryl-alcohol dehydrogenase-like predicted oxidoreductase